MIFLHNLSQSLISSMFTGFLREKHYSVAELFVPFHICSSVGESLAFISKIDKIEINFNMNWSKCEISFYLAERNQSKNHHFADRP